MNYAQIKYFDTADGEGIRTALYVSGCTLKCKGCHNYEAWDFNYGNPYTEIEENEIIESLKKPYVSGLSILGGEPTEPQNIETVLKLVERVRLECPDKTIWLYTGRTYDQVDVEVLKKFDVVVDGAFIEEQRDISLAYRGSRNQNIIKILEH